ncbi:MAG: penicillin-binding protein 2 [Bacteroidales bacterium]
MDTLIIRKNIIAFFTIVVAIIYLARLFSIQVIDTSYRLSASNNVLRYVPQYPARGLIYDRNGELMVYNEAAYDINVTPQHLTAFDTTEFCNLLNISKEHLKFVLDSAKRYSYYRPSTVIKQISAETYAAFQEKLHRFPGFFVQPRTRRKYSEPVAAHLLGYVGEVGRNIVESDEYYKSGDYIGVTGIEREYEEELKGEKGVKVYMVDVHNRIKGSYREGRYDRKAEVGSDIVTTIDLELQEYAEKLMKNKIGSIVAIEPSTGELLALASSPAYDPELLVGRNRNRNFARLSQDTLRPLFNRPLMASYPPGSTFKVMNALVGLQEGMISRRTTLSCHGGFYSGNFRVRCHDHPSPVDLEESIQVSCNTFYSTAFLRILEDKKFSSVSEAFTNWRNHVTSFGLGKKLNIDLPNELTGFIPTKEYYDRFYGMSRWRSLMLVSLGIGQGELGTTPLQMANMTAAIANRGYYYIPHAVRSIKGDHTIDERLKEKQYVSIDSSNFEPVIDGMDLAVNGEPGSGSTARSAAIEGITVCGKTGTAQNPHGEDHSIFIAFAPKDDPKIAVSVYIENGGYGATYAAPAAKLVIEKYLNREISVKWWEDYIVNANLIENDEKED